MELFDGIWTGEKYEYVSLGTFKLFEEQGTDEFFSSITSYDKLVLFNKPYDNTNVNFPISLYDFLKEHKNIIDIKYQVSVGVFSDEQVFCFSAMVVYIE